MLRKRAMLIGVSQFTAAPPLLRAVTDVEELSAALETPDGGDFSAVYECTEKSDVAGVNLRRTIEDFLGSGVHGELLLLYIASHADVASDSALIIRPSDFDPAAPQSTGVPISFIGGCINSSRASYVVVVLDTCFADAGAWHLFGNRPTPFPVSTTAPTLCVIASTRAVDAAADGAFAPLLAATIRGTDPVEGEDAVSVSRIFDEAAKNLAAQAIQFARKWEAGAGAIPFGRGHRGARLSAQGLEELYESIRSKTLLKADTNEPFDFYEIGRNRFGVEERIGIKLLPRGASLVTLRTVSDAVAIAVRDLSVQSAILLTDEPQKLPSISTPRASLLSFEEFRRRAHPLTTYLEEFIAKYEATSLHRFGYYVGVRARTEDRKTICVLDTHIDQWLSARDDVSQLVVLGDFGTGKTTTAKRLMWRQSTRYLARPHIERIPILVDLRNYNSIQHVEGLVQRTLAEVRLGALLSVDDALALNEDGRILWILDGFDEMASKVTPAVAKRNYAELQRLMVPKARVLITCRTHFFGSMEQVKETFRFAGTDLYAQLAERRYRILFVEPFCPDDLVKFVTARLRDPELHSAHAGDAELKADEILENLATNRELNDLATRPILAEMIVITLPDLIRKNLPINLATLYREYTDNLLERDAWREVISSSKMRHAFPQELAWHLYRLRRTELTFDEFPGYVKHFFADDARTYTDVSELIVAAQTTPLFQRDDAGNYAFAHKSFLEYYVARAVAAAIAKGDTDVLSSALLSPEVLRFLVDLLGDNPAASTVIATAAARSRFSLRYFLMRHFRARFVPILRRQNAVDPVQKKRSHAFVHLILPAVVATGLGSIFGAAYEQWFAAIAAFASTYAVIIAASFAHYTHLSLTRRVMEPMWRWNLAAILIVQARRAAVQVPVDLKKQIEHAIADLDDELRPVANHAWTTLQGQSVPTTSSKATHHRRWTCTTPPRGLVALAATGVTLGCVGIYLDKMRTVAPAAAVVAVGLLYGVVLASRSLPWLTNRPFTSRLSSLALTVARSAYRGSPVILALVLAAYMVRDVSSGVRPILAREPQIRSVQDSMRWEVPVDVSTRIRSIVLQVRGVDLAGPVDHALANPVREVDMEYVMRILHFLNDPSLDEQTRQELAFLKDELAKRSVIMYEPVQDVESEMLVPQPHAGATVALALCGHWLMLWATDIRRFRKRRTWWTATGNMLLIATAVTLLIAMTDRYRWTSVGLILVLACCVFVLCGWIKTFGWERLNVPLAGVLRFRKNVVVQ